MQSQKHKFFELVDLVEQSGKFSEILLKQQIKYQLQPFKIEGVDCQTIKRIYQSIVSKYVQTHELVQNPHNWNQNQRRVFIWYIIFYTYFLAEDNLQLTQERWQALSPIFFNKKPQFLQFQYLSMIKPPGKITWTQAEDDLLTEAVTQEGSGKWNEVAKYYFFQSKYALFKSPKHCRERWLNHLDNSKKHGNWTPEQDMSIFRYVSEYGKRWCKLVSILNDSRTEHMIKNRFNSLMSRQRRSKKEREDHIIQRVMRILKKQISNLQKKRQKKQDELNRVKAEVHEEPLKQEQGKNEQVCSHQSIQKISPSNQKSNQTLQDKKPEIVKQEEVLQVYRMDEEKSDGCEKDQLSEKQQALNLEPQFCSFIPSQPNYQYVWANYPYYAQYPYGMVTSMPPCTYFWTQ